MNVEHIRLTQYPYPICVFARMYPDKNSVVILEHSLCHEALLDMAYEELSETEKALANLKFHTVNAKGIIADELGYSNKGVVERSTRKLIANWKKKYEICLANHPQYVKPEITSEDIWAWAERSKQELSLDRRG